MAFPTLAPGRGRPRDRRERRRAVRYRLFDLRGRGLLLLAARRARRRPLLLRRVRGAQARDRVCRAASRAAARAAVLRRRDLRARKPRVAHAPRPAARRPRRPRGGTRRPHARGARRSARLNTPRAHRTTHAKPRLARPFPSPRRSSASSNRLRRGCTGRSETATTSNCRTSAARCSAAMPQIVVTRTPTTRRRRAGAPLPESRADIPARPRVQGRGARARARARRDVRAAAESRRPSAESAPLPDPQHAA